MVSAEAGIIVMPAIAMGLIIGIYEALLVHRDVTVPTHRFGHMVHALVFAVFAVFATMNVEFVLATIPQLKTVPLISNPLIFRCAIGLVTMIKVHGASAAIRGSFGGGSLGMKETWAHSLIIGALVAISPYVYPLIAPMLPSWLK